MEGRATTPEQKRAVIERIYFAWLDHPELRLGQLIINSIHPGLRCPDVFYIEDETLAASVAVFSSKTNDRDPR